MTRRSRPPPLLRSRATGDFQAGAGAGDVLERASSLAADFEAVMLATTDSDDGARITLGGSTITLAGVVEANLSVDRFSFV